MRHWNLHTIVCVSFLLFTAPFVNAAKPDSLVRLPGHVLPALTQAKAIASPLKAKAPSEQPLTLTLVLKRDDQAGFERYLREVYDPKSPIFRKFLTRSELADRFGPSREAYDGVLSYLQSNGLTLVDGSANRLTLTVRGDHSEVEKTFALRINDYKIGNRSFYANDSDPALPTEFASHVATVSGLSNLALPKGPLKQTTPEAVKKRCMDDLLGLIPPYAAFQAYLHQAQGGSQGIADQANDLISVVTFMSVVLNNLFEFLWLPQASYAVGDCVGFYAGYVSTHHDLFLKGAASAASTAHLSAVEGKRLVSGLSAFQRFSAAAANNNQKIGLLEFDTFHPSDVADWLALVNANPTFANRVSEVHVNGGVASPGAGESEVLLDIITAMIFNPSLNTSYVVYDAPLGTGFQQLFNTMINDGVTVISNSWSQCEDQTSLADAQSVDSVLAQAAASGISVFNASGDTGTTCLNGSPNTAGVPASSPHATAVGGTRPTFGPGLTYGGETWWNGSGELPPTGQGGFGVSRYFPRPAYQNGLTPSAMRSVPDVAVVADPRAGLSICQADAGGCPTGLLFGGTSMAAPIMAGIVAHLNEILGQNIGEANSVFYPLAGTNAFHSAASMGSDFAHVGLGSPNFYHLLAVLSNYQIGPVDPSTSRAGGTLLPVADGATPAIVRVNLTDANNFPVAGKIVSLTPNAGSQAVVSTPDGPSTDINGAVTFAITDTKAETVTFTVTDTTDDITLTVQPKLTFVSPPATAGGISANPTTVSANGTNFATVTVTLQNAQGQGARDKLVTLSQGNGHSQVTGPTPALTDANGQVTFQVRNRIAETVTYTATNVTDGDLSVPGSTSVTFVTGTSTCNLAIGTVVPGSGFAVESFAGGFPVGGTFNGNQCIGPTGVAFDRAGDLLVIDSADGHLYRFGPDGGIPSVATRVTSAPLGTCPWGLAFSKDGKHLYVARQFCSNVQGDVIEVDPDNGQILRTLVNLACATGLATDPISGDLFVSQSCGFGADRIFRVQNPESATPTVSLYSSPGKPDGLTFAPDGTLYAAVLDGQVVKITGTNTTTPGQVTLVANVPGGPDGIALQLNPNNPNQVQALIVVRNDGNITKLDLTASPVTLTHIVTGGSRGDFIAVGPDGCGYATQADRILKLTDTDGTCPFAPTTAAPSLGLAPSTIAPDPAQGTPETFTATLSNIANPNGAVIFFTVAGSNPQVKLVRADASGQASFTYTALRPGDDRVFASAAVGDTVLTSNPVTVTWTPGKHTTFLTLNPSPTAGTPGVPVNVIASLTDVSLEPPVPVVGEAVNFALGSAQCVGTTTMQGIATCQLVPSVVGMGTLTATFVGASQFVEAADSVGFNVIAAAPMCTPSAEVCDGQDNDCDGTIDEGNPGGGAACNTGVPGVCSVGTLTCTGGALVCEQAVQPSAEVCDGLDNNCNGQTDEGLTLDADVDGFTTPGSCTGSKNDCNDASSAIHPGATEICDNNIDEDCDGADLSCPPVDACTPSTILDTFDRADGSVGNNWRGATGTTFYRLAGQRLDVQAGGPLYWNPRAFGTNQAAFVTLSTVDAKSPSQGVLLKVQSGSVPNAGAIAVVYDALAKAVRVSTVRLGAPAWTPYGKTAVPFINGDKLGACAKANGEVRVYKNDALVKTVTLSADDQRFFNAKGGKVGVWSVLAPRAFLDNFGGGTIAP